MNDTETGDVELDKTVEIDNAVDVVDSVDLDADEGLTKVA